MIQGARVWAHVGTGVSSTWVKARVRYISKQQQGRDRKEVGDSEERTEESTIAKFSLEIENLSEENARRLNHSLGDHLEIVTSLVAGSHDEFESVKLRNEEDDHRPETVNDLVKLPHLHECSILHCLEARFRDDRIYTNTGPVLLSVNPYKSLQIYTPEVAAKYRQAGEKIVDKKMNCYDLPPHVYQVADLAYRHMAEEIMQPGESVKCFSNQSILVSGESGAGKTETTKFIMRYLADLTSPSNSSTASNNQGSVGIESQVLQSNPILESFGNARTLRNDNSSRFGKYIEINFIPIQSHDPLEQRVLKRSFSINGAMIRTYLLEKVRIIYQAPGERNYHVFYELVNGACDSDRDRLGLSCVEAFQFISQDHANSKRSNRISRHSISYNSEDVGTEFGVSDVMQYRALRKAMGTLQFSSSLQDGIFDIVAAILHLGNVSIEPKENDIDATMIKNDFHSSYCCRLLGFEASQLQQIICERKIKTHDTVLVKTLNIQDAKSARDSFVKALYGALFDSIIDHINKVISSEKNLHSARRDNSGAKSSYIGVLDIFGFESFQLNSFEQLCINYTNEKLQFNFNEFMFQHEQDIYESEGIEWSSITYPDNRDVLDLLENKTNGIFALCDEQVKFPRSNDDTLVNKLYEHCHIYPRFYAGSAERGKKCFVVKHYAGHVTYQSKAFLEKNSDKIPGEMATIMREHSGNPIVRNLAMYVRVDAPIEAQSRGRSIESPEVPYLQRPSASSNRRKSMSEVPSSTSAGTSVGSRPSAARITTLSGEFRLQLSSLMTKINRTAPHYIRCIKPNEVNQGNNFNASLVLNQLNCNGVLECIRVSRAGYPIKIEIHDFLRKYSWLASAESIGDGDSAKKSIGDNVHMLCLSLATLHSDHVNKHSATWRSSPSKTKEQKQKTWRSSPAKHMEQYSDSEGSSENSYYDESDMGKIMKSGMQYGKSKVFLKQEMFNFLEMKKLELNIQIATKVQAWWRKVIAVSDYAVVLRATVVLQCFFRCIFARNRAKKLLNYFASVCIQRSFRGHSIRKMICTWNASALVLQCLMRQKRAFELVLQLRKARAVTRLSTAWRRSRDFKRFHKICSSTLRIQMVFRCYRAKRVFRQLRLEAHSLRHQLKKKETLLADMESRLIDSKNSYHTVLSELESMKKEKLHLEVEFSRLKSVHESVTSSLEKQRDNYEIRLKKTIQDMDKAREAELLAMSTSTEAVILTKDEQIGKLTAEIESLRDELSIAQLDASSLPEKENRLLELERQVHEMHTKQEQDSERYKLVSEEWADAAAQVVDLKADISTLNERIVTGEEEACSMRKQLDDTKFHHEAKCHEADELKVTNRSLSEKNAELSIRIRELTEENDDLKKKIVRVEESKLLLDEETANCVSDLKKQLSFSLENEKKYETDNLVLTEKLEGLEDLLAQSKKKCDDTEVELVNTKSMSNDFKSRLDQQVSLSSMLENDLRTQKEGYDKEVDSMKQTLRHITQDHESEMAHLQSKLEATIAEKENLNKQKDKLEKDNKKLEKRLKASNSEVDSLKISIEQYAIKNAYIEDSLHRATSNHKLLLKENEEILNSYHVMKDKHEDATMRWEETNELKANELKTKCKLLREENTNLTKSLAESDQRFEAQAGKYAVEIEERDDQIKGLTNELADLASKFDDQSSCLEECYERIDELREKQGQLERSSGNLESALALKMDELVEKSTEMMVLQRNSDAITAERDKLGILCQEQRDELESIMDELSQMREVLAEKDIECASFDSSLVAKTEAVNSLSIGVLSLNSKLTEMEEELAAKNEMISDSSSTIKSLNDELEALSIRILEMESQQQAVPSFPEDQQSGQSVGSLPHEDSIIRIALSEVRSQLEVIFADELRKNSDADGVETILTGLIEILAQHQDSYLLVDKSNSNLEMPLRILNPQRSSKRLSYEELESRADALEVKLVTLQGACELALHKKQLRIEALEKSIQELVQLESSLEQEFASIGLSSCHTGVDENKADDEVPEIEQIDSPNPACQDVKVSFPLSPQLLEGGKESIEKLVTALQVALANVDDQEKVIIQLEEKINILESQACSLKLEVEKLNEEKETLNRGLQKEIDDVDASNSEIDHLTDRFCDEYKIGKASEKYEFSTRMSSEMNNLPEDRLIDCSHKTCHRQFTSMEGFLLHLKMEHDQKMFESSVEEDEISEEEDNAGRFESGDGVYSTPQENGRKVILDITTDEPSTKPSFYGGCSGLEAAAPAHVYSTPGKVSDQACSPVETMEQMMPRAFFNYIVENLQVTNASGNGDKSNKRPFPCLFEGCKKSYKSEEGLLDHMKDFHIMKHVKSPQENPAVSRRALPESWSQELKEYVSRSFSFCRTDSDIATTVAHLKFQIAKVANERKNVNNYDWDKEKSPVKPPPKNSSHQKKPSMSWMKTT